MANPTIPTSSSQVELQGHDLTIWRSTTSNRLRANSDLDLNDPPNSPLLTVLRVFLTVFTIISFAMATSPVSTRRGTTDSNGFPLDMTVNLTVNGGLHWNEGRTKLVTDPAWKYPFDPRTGMFESPASVLAVPALFGTVIKTSFKAPLLVLDAIDACDPFTVLLPEVDGLEDPIVTATVTVVPEPTVATAASPLVRTSGNTTSHIQNDAALNSTSNSTSAVTVDISSNATTPLSNHTNTTPSKTEDKTSHLKPRGGIIPDPHDHPHNPLDAFDDTDPLLIQPDIRRSSRWFVLIPRGNCPFDVKIYHAQKAGFSGAIIYNNGTSPYSGTADIPVRMSSNTLGDRISFTSAMYLTQHDGKHLLRTAASHRPPGYYTPLIVNVSPAPWPALGWTAGSTPSTPQFPRSIALFFSDLIFLALTVFVVAAAFAAFYIVSSMIRNYFVHGSLFVVVMHYAHASPEEEDEGGRRDEDKFLEKITLPIRLVKEGDLGDDGDLEEGEFGMATGGSRECCAICIDEFVVGSRVRQLPCKHQFHDLCIDPWLLKHNRLCPICKRDVLSMPTIPITTPPLSLEKPDASSSTSIVNERTLLITSPQDLRASEEGRSTSSSPESSRREMGWRWFFWRRSSSEESVVREETERRNQ